MLTVPAVLLMVMVNAPVEWLMTRNRVPLGVFEESGSVTVRLFVSVVANRVTYWLVEAESVTLASPTLSGTACTRTPQISARIVAPFR